METTEIAAAEAETAAATEGSQSIRWIEVAAMAKEANEKLNQRRMQSA